MYSKMLISTEIMRRIEIIPDYTGSTVYVYVYISNICYLISHLDAKFSLYLPNSMYTALSEIQLLLASRANAWDNGRIRHHEHD